MDSLITLITKLGKQENEIEHEDLDTTFQYLHDILPFHAAEKHGQTTIAVPLRLIDLFAAFRQSKHKFRRTFCYTSQNNKNRIIGFTEFVIDTINFPSTKLRVHDNRGWTTTYNVSEEFITINRYKQQ